MSILIDLNSVASEGLGASLDIQGSVAPESDLSRLTLGDIDFHVADSRTEPIEFEVEFINAGECIHASGSVRAKVRTDCVRCLRDFVFVLESDIEESFFFEPSEDEHGDPYPVIDESYKVDIEPLLQQSLLVEAPFAPVHDSDCQGLCVKCGMDLNQADCGCTDEEDASHPFAVLKGLV